MPLSLYSRHLTFENIERKHRYIKFNDDQIKFTIARFYWQINYIISLINTCENVIFKHGISSKVSTRWMPWDVIGDKIALVRHPAIVSTDIDKYMTPYGVTGLTN